MSRIDEISARLKAATEGPRLEPTIKIDPSDVAWLIEMAMGQAEACIRAERVSEAHAKQALHFESKWLMAEDALESAENEITALKAALSKARGDTYREAAELVEDWRPMTEDSRKALARTMKARAADKGDK